MGKIFDYSSIGIEAEYKQDRFLQDAKEYRFFHQAEHQVKAKSRNHSRRWYKLSRPAFTPGYQLPEDGFMFG